MTRILNPDFRRDVPTGKEYCRNCQKVIKNFKTAVAVTINWENWEVAEGHNQSMLIRKTSGKVIENGYIGPDCWKNLDQFDINP